MRKWIAMGVGLCALVLGVTAMADKPRVLLETTAGNITIELDPAKAPKSAENFLAYVDAGQYNDTQFHRVIDGFMIQGGGFTEDMKQKPTRDPIPNEADNGLKNVRGSVAMARTSDPNSATAQFFINLVDNEFLNFKSKDMRGWGYAVFGQVVDGMDTVDAIAKQPTGAASNGMRDVPKTPILIKQASRL